MTGNGIILLTGGTGFVGRQILARLLERGARVRAVVRAGREGLLPPSQSVQPFPVEDLFAASGDVLREMVDGVDTVVHAAWYAEPGKYLKSPRNVDCLRGTLELATSFANAGGRRFVGVGTCFEYDLSAGYLNTPYAAAKAAAYLTLSQYFAQAAIEFAWCRLFYLFGEGEDERRLVPKLRARLSAGEPVELTTGREVRDYLDVTVAGRLIADVALGDDTGPVNICSGVPITIREIAERIADEYGARHLLRWGAWPDDIPFVVGEVGPNQLEAVRSAPRPFRYSTG
jgi:nucleoside-diphosphate-sugar epimerase